MIETLMPEDAFMWTVFVMLLSSLTVIGLLFYGRYTRKKKDVAKAALKKYEETEIFIDPKMRFDPAVIARIMLKDRVEFLLFRKGGSKSGRTE